MPDTAKSTRPAGNRPGSSTKPSASQRAKDRAETRRQELAAQQQRQSRNRLLLKIVIPVAVIVLVVAVFVIVKVTGGSSDDTPAATGLASAAVVTDVTTVPASTLNTVGSGTVSSNVPTAVSGAPALTADGKPRVLYVGAEFCPYCAAERWPVTVALSRFGTWSNLGQATSAGGGEVFPNTATLSFHGATYSSQYLSFTGYETTDRDHQPLDTLSDADNAIVTKYDAPPYYPNSGTIPFIDFGGQYLSNGASYDPGLLAGMTHDQIAAALKDSGSDVAKGVDGAANVITAALCKLTDGQPGDVCSSSGVTTAAARLGS